MEIMQWIVAHQAEIVEALVALYTVASLIVGMTDTPEDDRQLGRVRAFLERLSFLAPRNAGGTLSLPGRRPARPVSEDE